MKFSLILPCYHVQNLLENFLEVLRVVSDITPYFEIIIVNDGNKTFPRIKQSKYIKVITFKENRGKGEALVAGFKKAKGEIIAFIDADLQIPAILLKDYYRIMLGDRNPDVLIGSKRHHNSQIEYPFIRRLYSWGYQMMIKILFGLKILDTQSGLKMFKSKVLKEILLKISVKRFAIDVEILFLLQKAGYKIIEAPIQIKNSFTSTINILAVKRMIQDTLGIWLRGKLGMYKEVKNENKRNTA